MSFKVGDKVKNNCDCGFCKSNGYFGRTYTITGKYDNNDWTLKDCENGRELMGGWAEERLLPLETVPKELFEL